MTSILVITHGRMAEGLLSSIDMIFGLDDDVDFISLTPEMNPEELFMEIEEKINKLEAYGRDIMIFVDLFGATPFNTSGQVWNKLKSDYNIRVISGVNLPMILEIMPLRKDHGVDYLYKIALKAGKEGIKDMREELYGN